MKDKIFKFINFYQGIIIKNIPFFIAVGIFHTIKLKLEITQEIIEELIKYVIPFGIAYTTGSLVEKKYGAITSVLSTIIFLSITKNSNILIILLLSYFTSYIVKRIKKDIILKYFLSIEMLSINLMIPIISIISGVLFFYLNQSIGLGFDQIFKYLISKEENLLFIIVITPIIEISKIFFLNNFINHGILFFLGYEEILEKGSSIFFLLETNPGPGLGVLLGYYFSKKDEGNILDSLFLEFLGGIHEVYFPYVLKNLKLLFALIIGGLTGNLIFYSLNITLYTLPSPGSIILIFLFTKSKLFYMFLGVFLSTLVSFIISYFLLLRTDKLEMKLREEEFKIEMKDEIKKIGIVCMGGIGTSSIGRNYLLTELEKKGCSKIEVENYSINEIEEDVQILITHKELKHRVEEVYKNKVIIILEDYLDKEFYKKFIEKYIIQKENEQRVKIIVEMNQKSNFSLEIEEDKIQILQNRIGIILEKKNRKEIVIKHYPYGILLKNQEIFLILKLSLEIGKINKLKKKIEELKQKELEIIEITDDEKDILNLLELEKF